MVSIEVGLVTRAIARFTGRQATSLTRRIVRELTAPPPEGTPRDTGLTSARWLVGIGGAPSFDPPVKGGRAARARLVPSALQRQKRSLAALTGYKLVDGEIVVGNGEPHISVLNAGGSPQSSPDWVQAAFMRAITAQQRALQFREPSSGRFRPLTFLTRPDTRG